VGRLVGLAVGFFVGAAVGFLVGLAVGFLVGYWVGIFVGGWVGFFVGLGVTGFFVGARVGSELTLGADVMSTQEKVPLSNKTHESNMASPTSATTNLIVFHSP
jgi:hypothetical protein